MRTATRQPTEPGASPSPSRSPRTLCHYQASPSIAPATPGTTEASPPAAARTGAARAAPHPSAGGSGAPHPAASPARGSAGRAGAGSSPGPFLFSPGPAGSGSSRRRGEAAAPGSSPTFDRLQVVVVEEDGEVKLLLGAAIPGRPGAWPGAPFLRLGLRSPGSGAHRGQSPAGGGGGEPRRWPSTASGENYRG